MTKRKFLQQEIDDYQRAMGPYDALAETFNQSLASAKGGTTYVYNNGGVHYLTDGASGEGLKMKTSHDYQTDSRAGAGQGAVVTSANPLPGAFRGAPDGRVITGWKAEPYDNGESIAYRPVPIYSTPGAGQIGVMAKYVDEDGNYGQRLIYEEGGGVPTATGSTGAVMPLFPNAPNPSDYSNGAPDFTKSEERTLKGEQSFTEMDRNSKGLLDRIKAQEDWRPFADSNLGLLQKVMQGKV